MGRSQSRSRSRGRGGRGGGEPDARWGGEDEPKRGGKVTGVVISWLDEKGFGFIKPDRGGDDIFAHASGLKDGDCLKEGSEVTFDENYDDKRGKYRAENIMGCVWRRDMRGGGRGRGRDDSRDRGRGRYDSRDRGRGGRRYDSRDRGRGRY